MAEYDMPRIHFRRGPDGRPLPLAPRINFDPESDTLFIFFYGKPEPSISVDVTDTMYALLAPETDDLIGIQTEAFTKGYVSQHPWLQPFVEMLVNPSSSPYEHEQDEHRDLASYFVGSLMTEGSLATA
jgi:hypothetical protein